jgi:hypothetical protein
MHFNECIHTKQYFTEFLIPTIEKNSTNAPLILVDLITTTFDRNTPQQQPIDEHTPDNIRTLIQAQNQIGWMMIAKGMWATHWIDTYNTLTSTNDGMRWIITIQSIIWNHVIDTWKIRNNKLHENNDYEIKRKTAELNSIIGELTTINSMTQPDMQRYIENARKKTEGMNNKQKEDWITNNEKYILHKKRQEKLTNVPNGHTIAQYFTRQNYVQKSETQEENSSTRRDRPNIHEQHNYRPP